MLCSGRSGNGDDPFVFGQQPVEPDLGDCLLSCTCDLRECLVERRAVLPIPSTGQRAVCDEGNVELAASFEDAVLLGIAVDDAVLTSFAARAMPWRSRRLAATNIWDALKLLTPIARTLPARAISAKRSISLETPSGEKGKWIRYGSMVSVPRRDSDPSSALWNDLAERRVGYGANLVTM
jgi:hypothetical protein